MAISWGPWTSNNRLRAGVELTMSPSTVGAGTASVVVTAKLWMQTRFASNESGSGSTPWSLTGSFSPASGSGGGWNLGAMGTKLLATATRTVATSYSGPVAVSTTGSFTSSFAYSGTTASVSTSISVPKRPIGAPAAPTGLTATRAGDAQQNLAWTNTSPTNAAAPYTNVEVYRAANGGDWARIATLGVVSSFQDKSTKSNSQYSYRVRATNSGGASAFSATAGPIQTTPAAPAAVTAKKAGADIQVSWTDMSAFNSHFEIWHAANGVWDGSALATITNSTPLPYVHAAPSTTVTHTYRIRSKTATPVLLSAYSAPSNVVQLTAPPLAPTNLSPSGVAWDANGTIAFSWQHNPVDTTDQRQFEFQYRVDGGAWVNSGVTVGDQQTGVVAAETFPNGSTIEWQVRTWGDHANPSPWSAIAAFTTSSKPTVSVNTPDGTGPVTSSRLTVTWGYFQFEGSPQAQWKATLYDAGGAVLQTLTGSDAIRFSATFSRPILDGLSYSVGVAVRSGAGLWSSEDRQGFTVDYAEPPQPSVTPYWLPDEGAVVLRVDVPSPVDETQPAAVELQVFRAVDGDEWRLVADRIEPSDAGASVTDYVPPLGSLVTYKAVAVSALPSATESATVEVLTSRTRFLFVNGGPGFAQTVRLAANVAVDIEAGVAKGTHQFAGRPRPVEWAGEATSRVIGLRADLFADWAPQSRQLQMQATWADIERLAMMPGPHCYRDQQGRRYFVSMSSASISGLGVAVEHPIGFTLTEIDWAEPIGASDGE